MHVARRILARLALALRRRWGATLLFALLLSGAAGYVALRTFTTGTAPSAALDRSREREVEVNRLQQARAGGPIVLELKEKSGSRTLAFEVGEVEALTIAEQLNNRPSGRQRTFDLMRNLVQQLGGRIARVVVSTATETDYYAKVVLETSAGEVLVDSRPGDAIALALRAGAPIYAADEVLQRR
jgi:bifunctional DNase/RNase